MIRRPPRSTLSSSSAASDVYKRQPLQFHITQEPLIEEYSVARNMWGLSTADMTEIARNSVDISAFDPVFKDKWIGENHNIIGVAGNDISKTNLTAVRAKFRTDAWTRELSWILRHASKTAGDLAQAGKDTMDVGNGVVQVNDVLWDMSELGVIADPVTVHKSAELVDTQKLQQNISSLKRQLTVRPPPAAATTTVAPVPCDAQAGIAQGLVGAVIGAAAAVSVMLAWRRFTSH
eukprot:TRINITY_DN19731_c0_g1_i3.p1 TRINITY_DN19731_c0_g1~~TRINITY_DN19731_c0_g1_i3.p1  ORF type:complete len:234 (+),score=62.82 TRINITY_DN19731_c0_g1_i3:96-797(+)